MRRRRRWVIVRALAALAVTLALVRRRRYIHTRLSAFRDTLARALHTVRVVTRIASHLADDTHAFLVPPPLPFLESSSTSQLAPCATVGAAGTTSTTKAVANVPHSFQQLLRLASTPEGLSIVRAMTAGVVDAYTSAPSSTERKPYSHVDNNMATVAQPSVISSTSTEPSLGCHTTAEYLVALLSSPVGSQVLSVAVGAAVREALWSGPAAMDERGRDVNNKIVSESVMTSLTAALTSDAGRRLVVDVAQTVTSTAMPHLVRSQQTAPSTEPRPAVSSVRVPSSRRFSASSVSSVMSSSAPNAAGGPLSDAASRVVDRLVSRSRTASFWERLAIIAIRDRALVHDVVRVVVTHAVRTYLVTQAELRGDTCITTPTGVINSRLTSTCDNADAVLPTSRSDRSKRKTPESAEGPTSVWRVLTRTVAVDLKRLLYSAGSQQVSSGWTVF